MGAIEIREGRPEKARGARTQPQEKSDKISLVSFSEMVGFPVEFIKKELVLDGNDVSLSELRTSMMSYLETTSITAD